MGKLFVKAVEKLIEIKKVNPGDYLAQDTVDWAIDIAKHIPHFIKELF